MPVITSKNKKVVIESTGHAASIRKLRCPRCRLGYAVESNTQKGTFICTRCGTAVKESTLG